MAKRTNRVAWGMAAILAVVVLGGSMGLFVSYQSRLPEPDRWVILLPRSEWGFGPDGMAVLRSVVAQLDGGVTWPERYRLGFWTFRVNYSTRSLPCGPTAFDGFP
jgi:hypothetical protein